MKTLWHDKDFCSDAFGEDLRGSFRDGVVARMTRTRKRARVVERAKVASILAAALLAAVLLMNKPERAVTLVSAPRTPAWKVRTAAFDGIVRTQPLSESFVVRSDVSNVAVVRTAPGLYDLISDEQMFAMLSGRAVMLVKVNGVADLQISGP